MHESGLTRMIFLCSRINDYSVSQVHHFPLNLIAKFYITSRCAVVQWIVNQYFHTQENFKEMFHVAMVDK